MSTTIITNQNCLKMSSEFINQLEPIYFDGHINLINPKKDSIDYAITKLKSCDLLGFDTESKPAFIKGQKFPISLIQLATYDEVFIFQVKRRFVPPELIAILSAPDILKIGVGVHDDIKKIKELVPEFDAGTFIDLSLIAKSKGLVQTSARSLTARYLNKRLVKSSQTTNWAKTNLSERQICYAATDAWVMLDLYNLLMNDHTDYHIIEPKTDEQPK